MNKVGRAIACVVVAVTGCARGRSAPAKPPLEGHAAARPAPAGFADCDLVALGDGTLETFAIRDEKVVQLGEIRLAPASVRPPKADFDPTEPYAFPLIGDWADRDHLFVRVGDRKVVMVTAAGVTDVALPDPKTLEIAHPDDASPSGAYGSGKAYIDLDLVVERGSAWWSRCPFSFANDGGLCFKWVNAQLWPSAEVIVADTERSARAFRWRTVASRLYKLVPDDQPTACSVAGRTPVPLPDKLPDSDESEHRFEALWLAEEPPRLLVMFGQLPEFSPPFTTAAAIYDGCDFSVPIARLDAPTAGPDGLWTAGGHVYRGPSDLGFAGDLRFRPPAGD